VAWGPAGDGTHLAEESRTALRAGDGRGSTAWLAPDEVDEMRVVTTYLASHDLPGLELEPDLEAERLGSFAERAMAAGPV
jgi:hypothetical protein